MNKLEGFIELKRASIPTVDWKRFEPDTVLDNGKLWTVHCAVYTGKDFDLPRMVGKPAGECMKFAESCIKNLRDIGYVVYYPYFVADKSGTMLVESGRVVVETVEGDLWNMVSTGSNGHGRVDERLILNPELGTTIMEGNTSFLSSSEVELLRRFIPNVKRHFRREISDTHGVLLEWSFARNCDRYGKPMGDPYLIFYEARTVG